MTVGYDPFVSLRYTVAKLNQSVALAALTGQRVYNGIAPPSAVSPYVIITLVSAEDMMVLEGVKIWTNILAQIEYWSRTNDEGVIAQGASLIHAALHRTSGTVTGSTYGSGAVYSVVRERSLTLPPEVDGEVIWRRGGGEYRQLVAAGIAA